MAWARAFYALAQGLSPGDRIVTGMVEYGANYVAMLQVIVGVLTQQQRSLLVVNQTPAVHTGPCKLWYRETHIAVDKIKSKN